MCRRRRRAREPQAAVPTIRRYGSAWRPGEWRLAPPCSEPPWFGGIICGVETTGAVIVDCLRHQRREEITIADMR